MTKTSQQFRIIKDISIYGNSKTSLYDDSVLMVDVGGGIYLGNNTNSPTIISEKNQQLKTINGESLVGLGNISINSEGSSVYIMEDIIFSDITVGNYIGQSEFFRIKDAILNDKQIAVFYDDVALSGYLYATQTRLTEQEDHIDLTFVLDGKVHCFSIYENDGLIDYYRIFDINSLNMPLIEHPASTSPISITPNIFHRWGEVEYLHIVLAPEIEGKTNQYVFEFVSGSTPTTLILPDNIKWADDNVPTIEANMIYQISILNGLAVALKFDNTKLISFITTHGDCIAEDGMTWQQWVDSSYNTVSYTLSGTNVVYGPGYITLNDVYVKSTDTIIDGATYGWFV